MASSSIAGGSTAPGCLEVQVLPDLIDFDQVSYAKVFLSYADPDNGVDAQREVVFVADAEDPVTWKVELKDDHKHAYQWSATFVMTDGSRRETPPATTEDLTLIPRLL
jgi:hypothetical protein